ncbi:MAG: L-histidine N(alpha)-methyltransferase [Rhodospirillaceae bacterium TMED8]|nr:L-histidine N(alpha)-methyltransferase [Magnetovibrio sp.]OUT51616.1 MAG: L-histidine N(alpha)-methyltransferase [Rhodospirillaceae bacterium TMED8]|tara:strand:+ start:639 stop:1619 length:981 start_codon:yes stop_codon:yes gene_type:complete
MTSLHAETDENLIDSPNTFLTDVLKGLSEVPKTLPSKYFYDAEGARLFTKISRLDAYYPTRTENKILSDHIKSISEAIGPNKALIEYGSGALDKVRVLLSALQNPAALVAIDISREQLRIATKILASDFPSLPVYPMAADFTGPIKVPKMPKTVEGKVAFFPGSTIGNFAPPEDAKLLTAIAKTVGPKGKVLIGFDLKKDSTRLIKAYDDPQGVTAAFNKNILSRINRELNANFIPSLFDHVVRYNSTAGRIEMHLESQIEQSVNVTGNIFHFTPKETVHTENSYKYTIDEFTVLANHAGLSREAVWSDPDQLFAVILLTAKVDER